MREIYAAQDDMRVQSDVVAPCPLFFFISEKKEKGGMGGMTKVSAARQRV